MHFRQRPFSGAHDLRVMEALARQFRAENLHVCDLPWRLSSWALDDPDNVGLWYEPAGTLVGWAVLQSPWWTIDIVDHPQAEPDLFPQILTWAEARARAVKGTDYARSSWYVMIFDDQTGRQAQLEAAGFACQADLGEDSWSKVLLERPGGLPVSQYRLPEGFTVRPLNGPVEAEAYVALQREVFESKNMTVDWRRRSLQHPDHHADLDLVIAADDGRLAAFCVCWLDTHGPEPIGQVEPLGCRAEFRRYALGRTALAEGIRRLQASGATRILVETDSYRNTAFRLYESMGFRVIRNVRVYRKDDQTHPS